MKFLHKTFELKRREIIEVNIDAPTKVKFLTGQDMKAYKRGKTHSYYGGLFEESPVRFVVPFEAVWNVVVEKGSYREPIEVHAKCGVIAPNSTVRSSIATDAPAHVREAEEMNAGALDRTAAGTDTTDTSED